MRRIEAVGQSTLLEHLPICMLSSRKQYPLVLGTPLALHPHVMKAMAETIVGNFPTLTNVVLTYASNLIAESLDVLSVSAVALTLAILAAKTLRRKRSVPKSFQAHDSFTAKRVTGRLFKSQRSPVLKQCPSCTKQLPLSAILCDICDYNFLAERPGRRQVLLQPPKALTHETPQQNSV